MSRRRRHLADDDVPRLPRGRGITLSTAQLVRIVMVAVALVALIALQKPCANSVSRFVTNFAPTDAGVARAQPDAGPAPDDPAPDGVMLHGSMTPAELDAAIARARASGAAPVDGGAAEAVPADARP